MGKEKDQIDEVALRDRLLLSEDEVAFVCGVSRPTCGAGGPRACCAPWSSPSTCGATSTGGATSRPSSRGSRPAATRRAEGRGVARASPPRACQKRDPTRVREGSVVVAATVAESG